MRSLLFIETVSKDSNTCEGMMEIRSGVRLGIAIYSNYFVTIYFIKFSHQELPGLTFHILSSLLIRFSPLPPPPPLTLYTNIIPCLQLDAGVNENILLHSRDEQSVLIVSYADLKLCINQTFTQLTSAPFLDS